MTGAWYYADRREDKKYFQFKLADKVDGTLYFLTHGQDTQDVDGLEIQVDYDKRKIISAAGHENVLLIEAQDAADTASLNYFIKEPDVKFLESKKEDGSTEAFV